jgi:hypothetical protein
LPAFVAGHGVTPQELGYVLGAATATRLVSAPLIGRAADRTLRGCVAGRGETEVGYMNRWVPGAVAVRRALRPVVNDRTLDGRHRFVGDIVRCDWHAYSVKLS